MQEVKMAKVRVYEIAKLVNKESKEILEILSSKGVDVKTASSSIESDVADELIKQLTSVKPEKAEPKKVKKAGVPEKTGIEIEQETIVEKEKAGIKAAEELEAKEEEPLLPPEVEGKVPDNAVLIYDGMELRELARRLNLNASDIIDIYTRQGLVVNPEDRLRLNDSRTIAIRFGKRMVYHDKFTVPRPLEFKPRPPVVTVLGHVDHGKTSLLDAIRKTNITESEAGGITQKIGASVVDSDGRMIVFVDTPGHEAFTAMRARGARVTDIAILVVAADDGVMPQTIEAINHVRAARVPILVAINKVDLPQANPEKVKQQLADHGLLPEDWGGDTICIPVSAKKKIGLEDLLEMLLLVSELKDLKAEYERPAFGTVIEARMAKGLGPVATVVIQNGTLKLSDSVVVGAAQGRVRVMINDRGERVKEAPPSTPVEIMGLDSLPMAGDLLQVVPDERTAKQISNIRNQRKREEKMKVSPRASLEELLRKSSDEDQMEVNIIIKADGQGSVEALRQVLCRLSSDEVKLNIIHGGVGAISESDVHLATASEASIIGFNVRPDARIRKLAESAGVDIRLYRVIYHVIEDVKAWMQGMIKPEIEEVRLGSADVRQVFKIPKIGIIAGCYVRDGKILRNADVRVVRDSVPVYEGKIDSLRHLKDDKSEVAAGYECGIGIEKFGGIQVGDVIEAYRSLRKKPKVEKAD
ncbi:MAG: translation initiation factor IF-2 [Chloroflexi bacterium]|nr:translation initiation factor IF-2 [Chloroflexota bacterium]